MVRAAKAILKTIKQPTIIIHSREDDYADLNNAVYLQKELTGTVDMVVLEDSYHMITLDKERHVVVERTRAFIDRVVGEISNVAANATPNVVKLAA